MAECQHKSLKAGEKSSADRFVAGLFRRRRRAGVPAANRSARGDRPVPLTLISKNLRPMRVHPLKEAVQ
jgi:hypothetical protein